MNYSASAQRSIVDFTMEYTWVLNPRNDEAQLDLKLLNRTHQERRGKRKEGLTLDSLLNYPDNLLTTKLTYFGGWKRKDFRKGERGVQQQPATTAMKTPKCGGLRGTDRAITTSRLPQRFHGVEHNLR